MVKYRGTASGGKQLSKARNRDPKRHRHGQARATPPPHDARRSLAIALGVPLVERAFLDGLLAGQTDLADKPSVRQQLLERFRAQMRGREAL